MAWWLTLLISGIGASGGVIGGWLSGRLGSRATLRAVREERAARVRVDYLVALSAFQHAAGLLVVSATEIPPERTPTKLDRWFGTFPQDALRKLLSYMFSQQEMASLARHPITIRLSRETALGHFMIGLTQSHAYEESVLRRLDSFLDALSRVLAVAPQEDLDLLGRVEQFVLDTGKKPPAQDEALKAWTPLRDELAELIHTRRVSAE